ncbi:MAG: helix-turn-helix domain-containing protein [Synergistaceae bacterium]|nr:helix-turn-helix domain-containing protein [Synergistaceae bacterium]
MTDTAKLLEQIRNIRRSIDSMNQQLNSLEDSLFQLAKPYPEQNANLNTNFNQDKEAWLTVREVCEALKISQATFYRLVNEGGLPEGFEFSPRNKRWRLSDIEAWQTAKKTQAQEVPQIVQVQRRVRGSKVKKYWELQNA